MKVKVKVIGTGGIGQCLIDPLCRLLNYGSSALSFENCEVALIDGDDFEEKNKPRQKFSVRGNKADGTKTRLEDEFYDVMFRSHPMYIDEDNIGMLIGEGDFVFLCVDNHKTRKLVSEYCQEELDNVTIINGGNNNTDGNVMVYVRRNGEDLTLPLHAPKTESGKKYHPEILNPPEGDLHPNEEEDREGCLEQAADDPQLLVANNMAAALMLNAFHSVTSGIFEDEKMAPFFSYDDTHFDIRNGAVIPKRYSQGE